MDTKFCSKCKKAKSISEFGKDKNRPLGVYLYCKSCARSINKGSSQKYRERNPEKRKCSQDKWAANNLERKRETSRRLYHERYKGTIDHAKKYAANRDRRLDAAKKQATRLSDGYVATALRLPRAHVPDELIEAKRVHLQIHRLLRDMTK